MIDSQINIVQRLDLGVAMREFIQGAPYIGTQVFPVFRSPDSEGVFTAVTRESLLRKIGAEKRAPGSGYQRRTTSLTEISFKTEEYGKEEPIDDSQRNRLVDEFDYDRAVAEQLTTDVLKAHEARVAAQTFDTGVFTGAPLFTDISSSAPFATPASDVIGAIQTAAIKVQTNCGASQSSLSLIVNQQNFVNLINNTAIVGRLAIVADKTQDLIANALASILGVRRVIVGGAVQNTANEGAAFSGGFIWSSTYAMLALINDSGSLVEPTLGRTILWSTDSPEIITYDQYREEQTRSDVLRARHHTDEKVIDPFFGHLLKVA